MSLFTRTLQQRTARGLIALLGGLWLLMAAAPCVMAAPCHDMGNTPCPAPGPLSGAPDCDSLQAADCQREEATLNQLPAPDMQAALVLLTRAPAVFTQISVLLARDADRLALRISSPPLYLQHAALLL